MSNAQEEMDLRTRFEQNNRSQDAGYCQPCQVSNTVRALWERPIYDVAGTLMCLRHYVRHLTVHSPGRP